MNKPEINAALRADLIRLTAQLAQAAELIEAAATEHARVMRAMAQAEPPEWGLLAIEDCATESFAPLHSALIEWSVVLDEVLSPL